MMTTRVLRLIGPLTRAEHRVVDAFIASCNGRPRPMPFTVTHAQIAKGAQVSVRTAIRALAKMEARGAMAACHLRGKGSRNRYWPVFASGPAPGGMGREASIRGGGRGSPIMCQIRQPIMCQTCHILRLIMCQTCHTCRGLPLLLLLMK